MIERTPKNGLERHSVSRGKLIHSLTSLLKTLMLSMKLSFKRLFEKESRPGRESNYWN